MSSSDQESYAQNRRSAAELDARRDRIRELNDRFRQTFIGGHVTMTSGIQQLGLMAVTDILQAVRTFGDFESGDDPYRERDFGAFDCQRQRVFWKIDYYDKQLEYGSPDPADISVTARVLTIMLASEY